MNRTSRLQSTYRIGSPVMYSEITYPAVAVIFERMERHMFKQQIPRRFRKLYLPTNIGEHVSHDTVDYISQYNYSKPQAP